MRTVKKHRRLAIAAGAVTATLAMGAASMVIAANLNGTDTIASRLLDPAFLADTAVADAPQQVLDPTTLCPANVTPGITCELWAKPGTIDIPGHTGLTIWGYATSATGAPMLPGPTIVATKGATVTVRVHNDLLDGGDLGFTARSMSDDPGTLANEAVSPRTAIANGGVQTYSFVARSAGTSVYSASPDSPIGNRQIAMGLSGVLVVRPAAASCPAAAMGCAYGDPLTGGDSSALATYTTATDVFDGEAIVATNEIDIALASSANPAAFDMTNYHPTAHLINGKAFPDTQVIDGYPGANVLIRYANLGLADHSMGLVGAYQRTVGRDGTALPHGSDDVTVPLNVGQTADVMVTVPIDAHAGYRYALADESRQPGAQSADPAMTFLAVWGSVADPTKPTGEVFLAPGADDVNGLLPMSFTFSVPAVSPVVTHVRWSLDDPGVGATVMGPLPPGPGPFPAVVPPLTVSSLVNGSHVLWMEWSNDGGLTWGDPSGVAFTIDRAGPAMSPVDSDPMYTNGTVDVDIAATADSTLTGTGEVTSALYYVGGSCFMGFGSPMTSNGPAPVVALTATIPASAINALPEGPNTVNVQAMDNRGMWSNTGDGFTPACGTGTIVVDKHAPTVSGGTVSPNNNDGTMAFPTVDTFLPVVRITAHVSDPALGGSGVAEVEGFIEDGLQPLPITTAMYGTGFLFTPVDGNFDSSEEDVYADIPLASVATLAPGDHDIWIHGRDLAGNWGDITGAATPAAVLTTINTAPTINDLFLDGTDLTINASANGTGVTIAGYRITVGAVVTVDTTIAAVDQTPVLNVTENIGAVGTEENVGVEVQDSTGKWSTMQYAKPTVASLTLTKLVSPPRQRLAGTVVPPPGGTVDSIEWSNGAAPAAPGTGTAVAMTTTSFNIVRNPGYGNPGDTIWVRAHDPAGIWGPAVAVLIP